MDDAGIFDVDGVAGSSDGANVLAAVVVVVVVVVVMVV